MTPANILGAQGARHVTAKEGKRCPACQKMVVRGAPAILHDEGLRSSSADRPARPRWKLYHPVCFPTLA